jgi:hypothetical protein
MTVGRSAIDGPAAVDVGVQKDVTDRYPYDATIAE